MRCSSTSSQLRGRVAYRSASTTIRAPRISGSVRFAAAASYHGGNLATDAPTSPHLLAPRIKAEVYVAAATDDGSYPPAMAERLEASLTQAGVRYETRTYPAAHGWMMPDFPVHDPAAAERGWDDMLALFRRTLHGEA
ncbi:dienelactone hydrolase family protein [Methylobacterium sp. J-092]|nr:dienelactone hydrolase family protein [Methylobacterium sp. J-092]